jgi:uncharacterized protein YkwD
VLAACGPADEALGQAAAEVARRRLQGRKIASPDELAAVLRDAGSAATWPRSLVFVGQPVDLAQAAEQTRAFVKKLPSALPVRCGVAMVQDAQGPEALAVIAAPHAATVAPTPRRVRPGAWVTVDVQLLGRFAADRPGRWLAQAVATLTHGPMPVAEVAVSSGEGAAAIPAEAPGEGVQGASDEATLLAMVNEARRSEGLPLLTRDARLAKLAQAHAAAMAQAQTVGHDVGHGDPEARAEAAGLQVDALGENVGRAMTLAQAHRGLWSSPSHRKNTLDRRWKRAGVGVVQRDGSTWVALLFSP